MSYVYFIAAKATNSVKIGFTALNPDRRLRAMQTGNADELTLLGWYDGTIDDEQRWHSRFAEYRIRGEWFRLDGLMADFIGAFLRNYWEPLQARRAA